MLHRSSPTSRMALLKLAPPLKGMMRCNSRRIVDLSRSLTSSRSVSKMRGVLSLSIDNLKFYSSSINFEIKDAIE